MDSEIEARLTEARHKLEAELLRSPQDVDALMDAYAEWRSVNAAVAAATDHDDSWLALDDPNREPAKFGPDGRPLNVTARREKMTFANRYTRRAHIELELEEDPNRSDRRIASVVGCDHKTVASVRERLGVREAWRRARARVEAEACEPSDEDRALAEERGQSAESIAKDRRFRELVEELRPPRTRRTYESVMIDPETADRLGRLAEDTGDSRGKVVRDALVLEDLVWHQELSHGARLWVERPDGSTAELGWSDGTYELVPRRPGKFPTRIHP